MHTIALILAPVIVLSALAVAGSAETAAPSPTKIAVFPFELEDFSAGAAYVPPDDIDREQLRLSTEEARRLMAASRRRKPASCGIATAATPGSPPASTQINR